MSLDQLVDYAISLGASRAKAVDVAEIIVFDERCRLKCFVPLCPEYGSNLLCPPNLPPLEEVWKAIKRYRKAVLVQKDYRLLSEKYRRELVADAWRDFNNLLSSLERRAFELGYVFAAALGSANCVLCEKCVGPSGVCKHPLEARPSMQALGIDVFSTAKKAGMPISMPIRDTLTWTGLLLVE